MQIVNSSRLGSKAIEDLGSPHQDELVSSKSAARQRLAEGQAEVELGLSVTKAGAEALGL